MDFIFDNIFWVVAVAAALVQWWKSTQEAKAEQKAEQKAAEARQRERESYEEFVEEVESRLPEAAVPPPLPAESGERMLGMERSPVPDLRRSRTPGAAEVPPPTEMDPELARQEALAEQIRELKLSKKGNRPTFDIRKKKKAETGGVGLRARLQNGKELKDAFVLKEILEKPVGLR